MFSSNSAEFGFFRSFFWPIYKHERRKVIPIFMMCFLICFNYSILRNLKDSLVVTAVGAEAIPFLKLWFILPMAVVATFVFTKLSSRFNQERVFYFFVSGFVLFFLLFAFVIYPLREMISPTGNLTRLREILPHGFHGMLGIFSNWTLGVFYVIAELWGTMVLTVLFWGFANEVTKVEEAKRFYGIFAISSNVAAILAGQVGNYFYYTQYQHTLSSLILVIACSGCLMMLLFRWINKKVLPECGIDVEEKLRPLKVKKKRLSLRDSFSYLSRSKYLILLAVIVISYNLVINVVEVVWKDRLKELYPEPGDFNRYLNFVTSMIGVVSTTMALFISMVIKRFGWSFVAMITPVVMLITSFGFFACLLFQGELSSVLMVVTGMTPLALAVLFGGVQNCFSKAAKFSVFDSTKEMAFIPLDHESKVRGKAAIDGIASRFGKSGGSLIHHVLLFFFGTVSASVHFVAIIVLGVIFFWTISVRSLGKKFNALVKREEKEITPEPSAEDENAGLQVQAAN